MLNELPAEKAYRILESGPIVLVATRGADDRTNLMTIGFHMMMQHDPPLVGAVIGPWDHSHRALSETGECVLAVPPKSMQDWVQNFAAEAPVRVRGAMTANCWAYMSRDLRRRTAIRTGNCEPMANPWIT